MFRTIPIKAKFSLEEQLFWVDQCQHANSLTNCSLYYTRRSHYERLENEEAYSSYWVGDEYRCGWKIYRSNTTYPELYKSLKDNYHYKAMAAQSAQQTLKQVGESITAYNGLVNLYYFGEGPRPHLPKYRKKGGLAAVTFPRQALTYKDGCCYPSISRETKPELLTDIALPIPDFIDIDWVRELRIRPCLGEFWIDWIIDDGKAPLKTNANLDYNQALGIDHGGTNWLTAVSTKGKSFIIDGRKLRSMNQGYNRLIAKYKQGKSEKYWDYNLDRVQRKRNNQMRDAVNKAARFIINYCLTNGIGNLVFGWNQGQKSGANIGKHGNQNFTPIPTGRLKDRLQQLCHEYGIRFTLTEESYTSKASFLDGDSLPKFGEKPESWRPSGKRVWRGMYKTANGWLVNADCNGAANIIRKVAIQLGLNLAEVGRGALTLPQRYDLFSSLNRSYRKRWRSDGFQPHHFATF